eukprot:3515583-Prymnesium_polylepis.2
MARACHSPGQTRRRRRTAVPYWCCPYHRAHIRRRAMQRGQTSRGVPGLRPYGAAAPPHSTPGARERASGHRRTLGDRPSRRQ